MLVVVYLLVNNGFISFSCVFFFAHRQRNLHKDNKNFSNSNPHQHNFIIREANADKDNPNICLHLKFFLYICINKQVPCSDETGISCNMELLR